ncbi:helix-turn-helix domain-containing protein [Mesorhizobium sp. B2-1-8]|uniref:helix-turn-helix domain-containing protein n=1 Tax=Mesorhizobium sp. B2-1-8 TaxID=2589967 RepID=UPI00112C8B98|nr:helix-turn-helix domain-containing protein [Mesorhizobium sp. B2-1-8]UCI17859.1 helix-turn-helix domain-containing protein [Mesorhizobium sp. B2-1-8]
MTHRNTSHLPLPCRRMLSPAEAADYCGGKTVDWLKAHVRVAPVKMGRLVRYDVRALDRWLDGLDNYGPTTGDDWLKLLD